MAMSAGLKCVRRVDLLGQQRAQAHESQRRERQPQQAARQADHARLDQALAENGAATGAERAPHADVAGAPHDFRQHQAHGIEQAHQQKAERHQHQNSHFVGDGVLIDQPLAYIAYPRVRRPVKAPGTLLLRRVVVQEGAIALARPPRLGNSAQNWIQMHSECRWPSQPGCHGIAGAIVVAPTRIWPSMARVKGIKSCFALAVLIVVEIVELRRRLPAVQDADHPDIRDRRD